MLLDHQPTKADITPPPAPRPDAVQLRARRSPRLIAVGVLAVVLGALGAAALYSMNTDHVSVVVMANDVVRGDEIKAADLTVVSVPSGLQVQMSGVDELDRMVGQTARSDLPAGSFPLTRHLGQEPIPAGHFLVGMKLSPGRLPSAELPPGTRVQLVSLAEGDDTVVDAVVASAPALADDGSGLLLDVTVPLDSAATVATLAATDQLVLIAAGDG
ncbi:MAG: SAF domain-containing protein [Propionibacteriaceae bacterium]|nr:SAF domain-containing protein [Propionibacteriaceae bacterium]